MVLFYVQGRVDAPDEAVSLFSDGNNCNILLMLSKIIT